MNNGYDLCGEVSHRIPFVLYVGVSTMSETVVFPHKVTRIMGLAGLARKPKPRNLPVIMKLLVDRCDMPDKKPIMNRSQEIETWPA